MKRSAVALLIFLALPHSLWAQNVDTRKDSVEMLLALPHSLMGDLSDDEKHLKQTIQNNIAMYLDRIKGYLELRYLDAPENNEALRKAENAIYLLGISGSNDAKLVLTEAFNRYDAETRTLSTRLASFDQNTRAHPDALTTREKWNSMISLQRSIIRSFAQSKDARFQATALSTFRRMDYSTQLIALRYLTDTKSPDPDFEQQKYQTLREIYNQKGQYFYQSDILKSMLDKQ